MDVLAASSLQSSVDKLALRAIESLLQRAVALRLSRDRGLGRILANPWLAFLGWRLLALGLVVVALVIASFLMVRLIPGDIAITVLGPDATESSRQALRQQLGVDQPILLQFRNYATNLLHGDLGTSFVTQQPVRDVIADRFPKSGALAAASLVVVLLAGIPAGLTAGALTNAGRHKRFEVAFTAVTSIFGAVPQFVMATLLAFIFAVWLRVLPVAGSDSLDTLVLPVASIAIGPAFVLARIVRVETLNVLAQDYIRTARSKRLGAFRVYSRHVLPNVLTAALTIASLLFANLVGGAILVENIFARVGLGTALVQAVLVKDYPVVQGIVIVLGVTVVLVNTGVEVTLGLLDPRSLSKQA